MKDNIVYFRQIESRMRGYRKLNFLERQDIIKRFNNGESMIKIAKFYGKSRQAISKVIKIYGEEARVEPKKASGRPRSTSQRLDKRIISISNADPLMSAPEIQGQLRSEGKKAPSVNTIRRRLLEAGKNEKIG